jgi:hypothetical protein
MTRELIEDLRARSGELGEQILDRLRSEIADYAGRAGDEILPAVRTSLAWILRPLAEERELTTAELAAFDSYGEARARQGIPAEAMLRAWRLSIRHVVDDLIATGRRLGVVDRAVLDLTRRLLEITDAATMAFTDGYHRVELELARQDEGRRAEFVRGVLLGTLAPTDLHRLATSYGLDTTRPYYALRARPAIRDESIAGGDGDARAKWLSGLGGMTALVDGDLAGFVERLPRSTPSGPVGTAQPAPLDQLQPTFRQASRALATAVAFGVPGVCDLSQLGLLPAVLADQEIGDELVRRYVEPLGGGEGRLLILETVRTYLSAGMRVEVSAEQLSVHHNTVRYRLRRYEELTGIDLRDPDRAVEAWWALQRLRIG